MRRTLTTFLLCILLLGALPHAPSAAGEQGSYSIEITYVPDRPSLSGTITVTATVSPSTNITGAKLGYALCTESSCGLFTYVDMQQVTEGVYRAEVGPFPEDKGYVEVKLKVTLELEDNSTYSSDVVIVPFQLEEEATDKKDEGGLPLSPLLPVAAFLLAAALMVALRKRKR